MSALGAIVKGGLLLVAALAIVLALVGAQHGREAEQEPAGDTDPAPPRSLHRNAIGIGALELRGLARSSCARPGAPKAPA
jgi:hypothetical protein